MKLGSLLQSIPIVDLMGDKELEIQGISYDSRQIKPGYLFVAIKGNEQDGHDYLKDALIKGATVLVAEEFKEYYGDVAQVRVPDSREALSKLARWFYRNPCDNLRIVGITGTNGKTTTSYILESIISAAGGRPGVIGTINYRYPGKSQIAPVTTPESLDLMRFLREMADNDVTHVIMEVSSHALDQRRTADCLFNGAIFTNLSRDHLDYHKTMDQYFLTKSLLFQGLNDGKTGEKAFAVINWDDLKGKDLASLTKADIVTYGLDRKALVRAESIAMTKNGITAELITPLGRTEIRSPLIGMVNIYNILSATAAAISLGMDLRAVGSGVEALNTVPGRLESVPNNCGLTVVVDYAHTPDALLKALETLRVLTEDRLITVFGCGGDRDKGKRSEMGLVAAENSDIIIITSDNPRREDPESIISQIEKGVLQAGSRKMEWGSHSISPGSGYFIEVERRQAIRKALAMADEKDLVLIAGKGHEDYQIVGTKKRHFDDKEEIHLACLDLRVNGMVSETPFCSTRTS